MAEEVREDKGLAPLALLARNLP